MIRILHILPGLYAGGATRSLAACARAVSRLDGSTHEAASLAPAKDPMAAEILRRFGVSYRETSDIDGVLSLMAEADIVHLHFWNEPRMDDLLHRELPPARLVVQCHVGGVAPPHVLTRHVAGLADMLLLTSPINAESPGLRDLSRDDFAAKTRLIPEAADFERLEGLVRRPHEGVVCAYLGTVDFQKMHPDYAALCAAVQAPGARFLVCGPGEDREALIRQAKALGLADRMDILPPTEDIREILAVTDVFAYPLCEDNYSSSDLVAHEAAFAGIPAVVLPYGGTARVVIDGYTGYVAQSPREYVRKVERLCRYPEERRRLGDNARHFAAQMFGANNVARPTLEAYQDLMRLPKRTRRPDETGALGAAFPPEDALLDAAGCKGAWRFVESLDDTAPWFAESMLSEDAVQALEADETIARSSQLMVNNGLGPYREYYPEDGFLHYWTGLVLARKGEREAALAACLRANRLGCDHWRVFWAVGRLALALGLVDLARQALERTVDAAPWVSQARQALEGLLKTSGDEKASLRDMRLRRELFTQAGDLGRAEDEALAVLAREPDRGDYEAYYLLGVRLHKAGLAERAKAIYHKMRTDPAAPDDLAGWALFKAGELLEDIGLRDEAFAFYHQALERNPDLAKARLYLAPPDVLLRVRLGHSAAQAPPEPGEIAVAMNPAEPELWEYYFARRRPNEVRLAPPSADDPVSMAATARLLAKWVAQGAMVRLQGDGEENRALASALVDAGLVLETNGREETVLRAPQGEKPRE